MRSQFTFYRSFWEAIQELPIKAKTEVICAICAYALDGEETPLSGTSKAIFMLIKPTLDASAKKAEIGKQGVSKREANRKQTASKADAEAKQDGCEGENENKKKNEIEIELENKCYIAPKKRIVFVPPTLAEVEAYVRERDSSVDPRQFFEYFQAGNWMDSKGQKVKNWKQKLLTWEKFQPKKPQPSGREALEELWAEYKAEGSAGMGELPEWIDRP